MSPLRLALVLGLMALSAGVSRAQDADALLLRANQAYQDGAYVESGALYNAAMEAGAEGPGPAYNAACSYALAGGHTEAAFANLERAIERGWIDTAHLQRDSDLDSLHDDPRWDGIVRQSQARGEAEQRRWGGAAIATPFHEDLSREEKVAGLSRLWAEVRFNFINFDLVPTLDWDSLYVATLPLVTATNSTAEYYRVLMATVAQLQDGHSNVYPPSEIADQFYSRPALRTRRIGDTVAVVYVYDDALLAAGIVPGVEVVAIEGEPVEDYAARAVRPYQSSSTEQDRDVRTYEYALLAGPPGPLALSFRRADGTTFTRTVQRLAGEDQRAAIEAGTLRTTRRPAFQLEWLPGNIAHIELNTFGSPEASEQYMAAFDEIANADAIVFDVRNNGGGNSSVGWAILGTLTDRPVPVSSWYTLNYRPAYRAWGNVTQTVGETNNTWFADAAKHYTGPVAVLTSARTFSAAEDFAVAFDAMDRGLLIGEPTGGSTGQPLPFTLPGGGSARVTTKRDTYPDGRDFVGTGVQPDMIVSPTLRDIRAGRDAVLDAAIQAVQTTNPTD